MFSPPRFALLLLLAFTAVRVVADEPAEVVSLRAKAEKGNALAQYNLGLAYTQGLLVPADLPEAFVWLSLASENGSTGKALDDMLGTISDAQLTEGRRRLREYRAILAAKNAVIVSSPGVPHKLSPPRIQSHRRARRRQIHDPQPRAGHRRDPGPGSDRPGHG